MHFNSSDLVQGPGMADQKEEAGWVFSNLQQFLQHALYCSNPSCILPLCVNTKLKLQHSRGCKKLSCAICQEVRYLASKHSESCVDLNCRIPFCRLNLSKCLDGIVNDDQSSVGDSTSIGRAIAATGKQQGCFESLSNNRDRESTPDVTLATSTSTSVSRPVISQGSLSPMTSNRTINDPIPSHNTLSGSNSHHRLPSDNNVFLSDINVASDTASLQWYGFGEPLPAYHESTLTTNTQERTTWPSLTTARANALANAHIMTDLSSPCLPTRGQNDTVSVQMSQNTNQQSHQSTNQLLDTTCFQTEVKACHSSPPATRVSSNGGTAKVNRATNTRILVKARLIDTLCSILQLIKRARSTEELLRCIRSLSIALGELIKKS